jgi:hypothetical protein
VNIIAGIYTVGEETVVSLYVVPCKMVIIIRTISKKLYTSVPRIFLTLFLQTSHISLSIAVTGWCIIVLK